MAFHNQQPEFFFFKQKKKKERKTGEGFFLEVEWWGRPPDRSQEESSLSVAHFGVSVRGGLKFQWWESASTGEGLSTGGRNEQ